MKYTNEQIQTIIEGFIAETGQTELRWVIPFCLGYFGYITKQIWNVITSLIHADTIKPH